MSDKIKILICDDSRIYRSFIESALKDEQDIEIIGSVFNGMKALEFIEKNAPDVITLDIEMPEMDGIQTLIAIQEYNRMHPALPDIGVIMVSGISKKGADITITALENGAFDFICKPNSENNEENIANLKYQLLTKIRLYILRKDRGFIKSKQVQRPLVNEISEQKDSTQYKKIKAILIGCSTGGPKALADLLPSLCEKTELPIFIVQHMPAFFTLSLAENLDKRCKHKVVEAGENKIVEQKHIYIAPGGKHLLLKKNELGEIMTIIGDTPPENNCKPSVDVLFRSASMVFSNDVLAIILTGMGNDGTKGLRPLKRNGVFVVVQDETTSIVWGMPGCAVEAGLVDKILPLDKIADFVAMKLR